jgi:hypothetical protein
MAFAREKSDANHVASRIRLARRVKPFVRLLRESQYNRERFLDAALGVSVTAPGSRLVTPTDGAG